MAIIDNQTPPAPPSAAHQKRVVVKFRPETRLPYSERAPFELNARSGGAWDDLAGAFPGVRLSPYFSTLGAGTLTELERLSAQTARGAAPPAFASYFAVDCPNGVDPKGVMETVARWPNVETAYVEAGPTPPPQVSPGDDPRSPNQGYLDAAPGGVDARWAWSQVDGAGVGFVDMERGWTLNHEDLAAANISVISGINQDFHGHGTAVLGEVIAVDNATGGIGLSPNSAARVVSQWRSPGVYNTAEAILSAASVMSAGDVLLLEAQTSYPTAAGFVPVEVEPAVFDAIQFATSQGIVVVEAGANGSVDLDAFQDMSGRQILNRNSPDFRDSGAILVGAASSAAPHARLGFSNFGSRVDCFAWGENIDTAGDGWMGTNVAEYTTSFGGTSGASPIVTGAALLLQSVRVLAAEAPLTPAEVRQRLSDPTLNTASANPTSDRIGVMPNLRALIGDAAEPCPEPVVYKKKAKGH